MFYKFLGMSVAIEFSQGIEGFRSGCKGWYGNLASFTARIVNYSIISYG
jgi:hypothetical protein